MPSELTVTQDITLAAVLVGTLTGVVCQAIALLPLTTETKLVSSRSTYPVSTHPANGHYSLSVLSDTYAMTDNLAGIKQPDSI
jgi:hypothetical protein